MSAGCLWLFSVMSGGQGAGHRAVAGPQQQRPQQTWEDFSDFLM